MPRPNLGPRLSDEPNDHGSFEIIWSVKGRSKRTSVHTGDRSEAQRRFAKAILAAEEDIKRENVPLINDVLDWYLDGEHFTEEVRDKARIHITLKFLRPFFGDLPVNELNVDHVADYKKKRLSGKIAGLRGAVKNPTIRRELTTLKAALTHCHKAGKITSFPYIHLPKVGARRERWLTHEEADMLKAAAARGWTTESNRPMPRILLFIWLALETASRRKALEELTWFQVDLPNGKINLNPAGRVQTKKFRPTVPISKALMPFLTRAKNEGINEFVLRNPSGLYLSFGRAVKRAGLGPEVVPHILRHTYATWAAQRGVPMDHIAGVLGDSVATVDKIYRKHVPEFLRGAVDYERS